MDDKGIAIGVRRPFEFIGSPAGDSDLRSYAPFTGRPMLWTFARNVRKIRRFG